MLAALRRIAAPTPRDVGQGLALGLVFFIIAAISFRTFGTLTPIWFANAVMVAALLRTRRHVWPLWLTFQWLAEMLALKSVGSEPAPLIAIGDALEVLLMALLIRRTGGAAAAFSTQVGLVRYIGLCLAVPLVSSAVGATIISLTGDVGFFDAAVLWYFAATLGLLIVGPPLLIWSTPELRHRSVAPHSSTAGLTVALAALAWIIFLQPNASYLFVTFPAVLLLVWSSGLIGATTGVIALLAVGLLVTLGTGGAIGALVTPHGDLVLELRALQIYIAAVGMCALPLAVALTHLRELAANLARVAAARGEFLAAMSHEIRTPMTGVLGMIELLEAEELTDRQKSYVESIRASGRHLLSIINDVLDFSRIETGRIELEHIDFSIPAVLERAKSMLHPLALERGLELRFEIADHSPPVVKGDPTRLKQVLLNLVANAIKFTSSGSVAVLTTFERATDGFRFRFEVHDTGIGISEAKQRELFTAFRQGDQSTTRRYGGTGLGLAISKRLIEAMGGEIGVSSAVGVGSLFWFEVPFAAGNAVQLPAQRIAAAAPTTPRRLLVAEDIQLNRDLIGSVLEREGHCVTFAENGLEALRTVGQMPFDLVLMDVQMPVMDGIEATRRIRKLPRPAGEVPIIALTANVMAAEQRKCIEAGMNDVLMKPIEWEHVRAVIGQYPARTPPVVPGAPATAPSVAPGGKPAAGGPDRRPFVKATFVKVRDQIPAERLSRHVAKLECDVDALAGRTADGDVGEIGKTAHRIVSQAGMLGLMRLSARAAEVERACAARDGVARALASFAQAATDLGKLRPFLDDAA